MHLFNCKNCKCKNFSEGFGWVRHWFSFYLATRLDKAQRSSLATSEA